MLIIARVSFPKENLKKAVKVYTNLVLLPVDIERDGPYFRTIDGQVEAITYYSFNSAVPTDPLKFIRARYQPFAIIPGFVADIDKWQSLEQTIGRLVA